MVRLQREPIDAAALLEGVGGEADGAVALFLGTVRDRNRGRVVEALHYDAYEEMARAELARVREEALRRFEVRELFIVHRLGDLALGETAVAVVAAAAHRAAAFDACRFAIDTLKRTVPIWKRERFAGGEEWIEGGG